MYSFKNFIKNLATQFVLIFLLIQSSYANSSLFRNNNARNIYGITPLMSAVTDIDIAGVKFFARSGHPYVNVKNIGGATALHLAARVGNLEIIKILIQNEARIDVRDNEDWTPIMRAASEGNDQVIKYLISQGANAAALNNTSESIIILSANSSCSKCLQIVLDNYNFKQKISSKKLRIQVAAAFEIARNKENQEMKT